MIAEMTRDDLAARVRRVRRWRHRIVLPGGVVTPGSQETVEMLPRVGLPPNLTGKSVLDVGCSDGFFSFECERRGASVVAVDDYSSVYISAPTGFETAREILGSRVELRRQDLFDLSAERDGRFDLVLFLGVLYHLRHPLLALERIADVCLEQVIVETVIAPPQRGPGRRVADSVSSDPYRGAPYMTFFEDDQINRDPTTWWAPSPECLTAMLRSCGFEDARIVWTEGDRAVAHGFHPRLTDGPSRLVARHSESVVAEAYARVLGSGHTGRSLVNALAELSILQYGRVKQMAAELRAQQWHQSDRWKS